MWAENLTWTIQWSQKLCENFILLLNNIDNFLIKMEANVISCTTWVKKGIAAAVPEKVGILMLCIGYVICQKHIFSAICRLN